MFHQTLLRHARYYNRAVRVREHIFRVLAAVKNTALSAVSQVTLRLQFPNAGQPKNPYIVNIQLKNCGSGYTRLKSIHF